MDGLTIACRHCGPVRVENERDVRYVRGIIDGFAAGHCPLVAITCPLCRDEVLMRDVRIDVDPMLAGGRETR